MNLNDINKDEYTPPLDIGLSIGWQSKWELFVVSIFFAFLHTLLGWFLDDSSNLASTELLSFAIYLVLRCWFFLSIIHLSVTDVQRKASRVSDIIVNSLLNLPKIIFGSIVLVALLAFSLSITVLSVPMWICLSLSSWSLIFVALDIISLYDSLSDSKLSDAIYSKQRSKIHPVNMKKQYFDTFIKLQDESFLPRSGLDFGIMRSIIFSITQPTLTCYAILFSSLATVFPIAAIHFVSHNLGGLLFEDIISWIFSSFCIAYVIYSLSVALIVKLPEKTKRMIDVHTDFSEFHKSEKSTTISEIHELTSRLNDESNAKIRIHPLLRIQGRFIPSAVLLVILVFSTMGVMDYMLSANGLPKTAFVSLLKDEVDSVGLTLTISVKDSSNNYSWIDPGMFVIGKIRPEVISRLQLESVDISEKESVPIYGVISPSSVSISSTSGLEIGIENLKDVQGDIVVKLAYKQFSKSESAKAIGINRYYLFYQNFIGVGRVIAPINES